MAIEDAAVLGTLFTYVASLAHIAPLLEAYESIRLPRATEAQLGSRVARDRQHLADPEAQRARDEEDKAAMEAELRKAQAIQQGASEGEALKPTYPSEGDGKPSHDSRSHFVGDVRAEAVQWWDTKGRALLSELS
jgi:salicylate hydroxylase